MTLTNFDLRPDGNIKLSPLTGYSTATAVGMACLLRLEYAASDEDLRAQRPSALQLALTPAQAQQLAQGLLQMADAISRQNQSGVRN